MKKTFSIIASLSICAGMITVSSTNAIGGIVMNTSKYERWYELEEYIEGTNQTMYRRISGASNYYIITATSYDGSFFSYAPFSIDWDTYNIKKEEALVFEEFMANNYPGITIGKEVMNDVYTSYTLSGATERSTDENFEIAVDIKENTGFKCSYCWLALAVSAKTVGDINSDNAITASDAAMVLSYYAQGQTSTASAYAESDVDYSIIADYNNDGAVTSVDAALILSDYAEGQIS